MRHSKSVRSYRLIPTLNQHLAQNGSLVTCADDGCATQSSLLLDRGLCGACVGSQHSVRARPRYPAARHHLRQRNRYTPILEDTVQSDLSAGRRCRKSRDARPRPVARQAEEVSRSRMGAIWQSDRITGPALAASRACPWYFPHGASAKLDRDGRRLALVRRRVRSDGTQPDASRAVATAPIVSSMSAFMSSRPRRLVRSND